MRGILRNNQELMQLLYNAYNIVDRNLLAHGQRVAYIMLEVLQANPFLMENVPVSLHECLGLIVFHDIGAYKTDLVRSIDQLDTHHMSNHSIYGYLFTKYISPFTDLAEVILYHHTGDRRVNTLDTPYRQILKVFRICDYLDIYLTQNGSWDELQFHSWVQTLDISERTLHICLSTLMSTSWLSNLSNTYYEKYLADFFSKRYLSKQEEDIYLDMLATAIDFRSEFTVRHVHSTVSLSLVVASYLGCTAEQLEHIRYGALLHDVGKIAISKEVLESPYKLTDEEMAHMRTHVYYTEQILAPIIPDHILQIAIRHHEKLDGSGYPNHYTEKDLTLEQRIVAVGDILSALLQKRSYKEPFSKEKIIDILTLEAENNKLCRKVVQVILDNYDNIVQMATEMVQPSLNRYLQVQMDYTSYISNSTQVLEL